MYLDLLYVCVVVYLDDILVFSADLMSYCRHVLQVLALLLKNSLYAKLEKCLFEHTSLPFLGYVISDRGRLMDLQK